MYGISHILPDSETGDLMRLGMLLDPRDRYLNVQYAAYLAKMGDFKKCDHVYQKFVARNYGLFYMVENQEQSVLLNWAMFDGKAKSSIMSDEPLTESNYFALVRVPQFAILCQIMRYMEEQRWDIQDLFYVASSVQQKPTYIKMSKDYFKFLLRRDVAKKVVARFDQMMDSFKEKKLSDAEVEMFTKFYKEKFAVHTKFDNEYQRPEFEDFFCVKLIQSLGNEKPEIPAQIRNFLKTMSGLGTKSKYL